MSSQLIIGILLIVAGILLAVVAYWVISGSGPVKEPESAGDENEGAELEAMEIKPNVPDPLASDDEDISSDVPELPAEGRSSTEQDSLEAKDVIAPEQPPKVDLHSEAEVETPDKVEDETRKAGKPDLQPTVGPRISIATLLRDEVTGQLIVKVGDKEYQNPDDLRVSSDWTRVEFAASDLQTWITKDAPGQRRSERGKDAIEPKPMSMIEQIDAILQEKIESSGRSDLGVRLLESPGGAARVLIGVQSYALEDVPDEEVQQFIQEAVASWEANQ